MSPSPSALPVRAERAAKNTDHDAPLQLQSRGEALYAELGNRRYRIRGLADNHGSCRMRVNLLVARDELLHVDTLDLYQARARRAFLQAAAAELYVEEPILKQDLGRLLLALEQLQQAQLEADAGAEAAAVEITPQRRDAALELLRDPQLCRRILRDYATCGLVGEETNKLLCYLACTSRLLPSPLAVLIHSSSAAGKTSLMDATLALMPEEQQLRLAALTGRALYYMGRGDLKHKILAVAEEEGVAQAGYALKLLQSDGRLQIALTGRRCGGGQPATVRHEVEGPVMMFLTTTSPRPEEELANRCLVLQVDESRRQTAAIQQRQRAAYTRQAQQAQAAGRAVRQLHHDAQRLLRPLPVVIPQVGQLRFRDDQPRRRRDHAKYLALIAAGTLLHQYQRPRRTLPAQGEAPPVEYLEATAADVQLADRLMREVLQRSRAGLLPRTRQLLAQLHQWVRAESQRRGQPHRTIRFTQRQVREACGWSDFSLRHHLARLVELEYVLAFRTGRRNQREYELADPQLPLLESAFSGSAIETELSDGQPPPGALDADSPDEPPPEEENEHFSGQNEHSAS